MGVGTVHLDFVEDVVARLERLLYLGRGYLLALLVLLVGESLLDRRNIIRKVFLHDEN